MVGGKGEKVSPRKKTLSNGLQNSWERNSSERTIQQDRIERSRVVGRAKNRNESSAEKPQQKRTGSIRVKETLRQKEREELLLKMLQLAS